MSAARLRGLYAITPDDDDTARLVALVAAAIDGGATAVQYRNKGATAALAREQADALARLCRERDATFIVNDRADLALAIAGAGLHVGREDLRDDADGLSSLRAALGPGRVLGVSCYADLARAREAVVAGADYVAFGSVFASPTKPAARPAPLSLFAAARDLGVPLVGIGGIDASNVGALVAAGADAAAVIADLFGSREPRVVRERARVLSASFDTTTLAQ